MRILSLLSFLALLAAACAALPPPAPAPATYARPVQPASPTPEANITPLRMVVTCGVVDMAVLAWADVNGDGVRDASEPPLMGVQFWVTPESARRTAGRPGDEAAGITHFQFVYGGVPAVNEGESCRLGEAKLLAQVAVEASAPAGYRLTTKPRLARGDGAMEFGFAPVATAPATPTTGY